MSAIPLSTPTSPGTTAGANASGSRADSAPPPGDALVRLLVASTVVGLLLIPIRAKTVGYALGATLVHWRDHLYTAVMTACYDIAFVAATAALFALPLLPPLTRWVRPITVVRTHLVFCAVVLLDGLSNIRVIPWLGQPFNFQWLYYADFFRSPDGLASILATVPWWALLLVVAGTALFLAGLARLGAWTARKLVGARARRIALALLVLVTTTYLTAAFRWRHREGWSDAILVNPVWAFAESCLRALRTPPLLLVATPYSAADYAPPPRDSAPSLLPAGHTPPRNIVIFVLESVAAQYTGLHGAPYGATPVLDRQVHRSAIFTRAYAHAPSTNLTLVSLLTGRLPRVTFRPVTTSHPDIALPHLPALLRERGYATGFFSSASLDFQRADEFLAAGGGFERIDDEDARPEAAARALKQWSDFVGTDDESTIDSMIAWAAACGDRPFFGVMWTAQSHFPYYAPEHPRRAPGGTPEFNRYLNAVAEGDRALGRLLDWLDATGRADDTLVIAVGDHGQAFGQHGTHGHAGHTWEEHLHVPLVLINPRLFSGQAYDTLCGLADIAPTITDLLDLPELPGVHGFSLLRTQRPETLYFFAAWSDFLIGHRTGDLKVVYNMTRDSFLVHDLARDPEERRNLATEHPDLAATARLRLAGWMQWVEATYREAEALQEPRRPEPAAGAPES